MHLCFIVVVNLGLCLGKGLRVYHNVTEIEYDSIPNIFELDDYDKCMRFDETLYCFAEFQLRPKTTNNASKYWEIVHELSSISRNYKHDLLRHGICIPKSCRNIPKSLYVTGNGTSELWKKISECHNSKYSFMGLMTDVVKLHCENAEPFYKWDSLDTLFSCIAVTLLLLLVFGSTYDYYARCMPDEYEYLTTATKWSKVLISFSILRNWERLTSETKSEDEKALLPLQGVRVINMYFVVACHTVMISLYGAVINTRYAENVSLDMEKMFFINGGLICQTFFIISGWLLSYKICEMFYTKKMNVKHVWLGIINRYIRLAPILIFTILFDTTLLRHAGKGPMWHKIVGIEYESCRKNWMWNLLFLNNYVNAEKMCLHQTWYISSDMQLYIIGLIIMMVVINNPKRAKKIFAFFILFGIGITFVEHYYKEFDIVIRSCPETLYNLYTNYRPWLEIYITGHNQLSCYVQGLACGYYFYILRLQKRTIKLNRLWYALWALFVWSAPIATILVAHFFYQEGFECSRFLASLYHSTMRYSFGLPISVCLFGLTCGLGGPMRAFTMWKPFRVLGRLSLAVFLWHVFPMRIVAGTLRAPGYVNDFIFLVKSLGDFAVAYGVGTVVCLGLEMPVSALQSAFMTKNKKTLMEKKTD